MEIIMGYFLNNDSSFPGNASRQKEQKSINISKDTLTEICKCKEIK